MPVVVKVCFHPIVCFWFLFRASVFCIIRCQFSISATPVFVNALPSMYVPAVIVRVYLVGYDM